MLTALGIAIGIAALVATVGISQSAGASIVTRFHETQSTFLTAAPPDGVIIEGSALTAVREIEGVTSAIQVAIYNDETIRARAPEDRPAAIFGTIQVMGVAPEVLSTIQARLESGRAFDRSHVSRGARVGLMGVGAARRMEVSWVNQVVVVDGKPIAVIGILDESAFFTEVLNSILMPEDTALELFGEPDRTILLVDTQRGATYQVAAALPYTMRPLDPGSIRVSVPPPPPSVAAAVTSDLDTLVLVLASVGALVAAITVAAIMTINVMERVSEIGLRRALGASREAIAIQFIMESVAIGLVGGIFGTGMGLVLVLTTATNEQWVPVMSGFIPPAGVAIGAVIGMLSGLFPAIRAARVSPSEALRA